VTLSPMNFGPLPAVHQQSRLGARFYGDAAPIERLYAKVGQRLSARDALEAGLVTAAPDTLDWDDELRQAIETRTALSPDALTGMEQNLRFGWRRRSRRRSSAASRRGRTGSSSGRTPSARPAR